MTTKRHRDVIKNQPMPKALLHATINPGVEKEWNEWYDKEHLPESGLPTIRERSSLSKRRRRLTQST